MMQLIIHGQAIDATSDNMPPLVPAPAEQYSASGHGNEQEDPVPTDHASAAQEYPVPTERDSAFGQGTNSEVDVQSYSAAFGHGQPYVPSMVARIEAQQTPRHQTMPSGISAASAEQSGPNTDQ